jgi:hypothetical protein
MIHFLSFHLGSNKAREANLYRRKNQQEVRFERKFEAEKQSSSAEIRYCYSLNLTADAAGPSAVALWFRGGTIGQQNASSFHMMSKKTAAQGFGITLATPLAIAIAAVAYKAWPQLHVSLILMIFVALWAALFKAVFWVFTRDLPITGAERRRRNKQFYDWLRSQGSSKPPITKL